MLDYKMNLHSTGYGPSNRLYFDGSESKFELWQVNFLGYLRLQKLQKAIEAPTENLNNPKFAEIIQCLDDRIFSLIMREASNDGRKALNILRESYVSKVKPEIITELTSLKRIEEETITGYINRVETTTNTLLMASEIRSDSLLISMAVNRMPRDFKPFASVVTKREHHMTFSNFKIALRSYEVTENRNKENV